MSDQVNEREMRSFSGYVRVCEKMTTGMLSIRGAVSYTHLTLPTNREV